MANSDLLPVSTGQPMVVRKITLPQVGSTDLRAISGYPTHCPQLMQIRIQSAGSGDVVFTDYKGTSTTITTQANDVIPIDGAFKTLGISAATGGYVLFAWWVDGSTKFNP